MGQPEAAAGSRPTRHRHGGPSNWPRRPVEPAAGTIELAARTIGSGRRNDESRQTRTGGLFGSDQTRNMWPAIPSRPVGLTPHAQQACIQLCGDAFSRAIGRFTAAPLAQRSRGAGMARTGEAAACGGWRRGGGGCRGERLMRLIAAGGGEAAADGGEPSAGWRRSVPGSRLSDRACSGRLATSPLLVLGGTLRFTIPRSRRRVPDCIEDLEVGAAAAEIARESVTDLVV